MYWSIYRNCQRSSSPWFDPMWEPGEWVGRFDLSRSAMQAKVREVAASSENALAINDRGDTFGCRRGER